MDYGSYPDSLVETVNLWTRDGWVEFVDPIAVRAWHTEVCSANSTVKTNHWVEWDIFHCLILWLVG